MTKIVNIHCVGILPIYYPFLLAIKSVSKNKNYGDYIFNFIIRDSDSDNFEKVTEVLNNSSDHDGELNIILSGLDDYKKGEHPVEPLMVLVSRIPLFGVAKKEFLNWIESKFDIDFNSIHQNIIASYHSEDSFRKFEEEVFGANNEIKLSTYQKGTTVYNFIKEKISLYTEENVDLEEVIKEKIIYESQEFGKDDLFILSEQQDLESVHNNPDLINRTIAFTINPWLRNKDEDIIVYRPPEEFISFTHIFTRDFQDLDEEFRVLLNEIITEIDNYISKTYSAHQFPTPDSKRSNMDQLIDDLKLFYGVNSEKGIINTTQSFSDNIQYKKVGSDTSLNLICMWLPGLNCKKLDEQNIEFDEYCCFEGTENDFDKIDESLKELINMASFYRIYGADYDVLAFPENRKRKTEYHDEQIKSVAELNTSKSLQKAWAHSLGNELRTIWGLSESVKMQSDKFRGILEKHDYDILDFRSKLIRLDLFSQDLYERNRALFRLDDSDSYFVINKEGKFSLKKIILTCLAKSLYTFFIRAKHGEERYDYILQDIFDVNLERIEMLNEEVLSLTDSRYSGKIDKTKFFKRKKEISYELDKISKKKQKIQSYIKETEDLLIHILQFSNPNDDKFLELENLLYSFLMREIKFDLNETYRLFDSFEINISENYKTDSELASHLANVFMMEVLSNILKYTKTYNNKRFVKIEAGINSRQWLKIYNSSDNFGHGFNKDGHHGVQMIAKLLPKLVNDKNRNLPYNLNNIIKNENGVFKVNIWEDNHE